MEVFVGLITYAGFNFAPRGWATCQGQILSISTNTALFSLIGTTYGGNGQNTFQLPNAGGRALLGQGQSPGVGHNYQMGEVAGTESTTLNATQMPQHTHGFQGTGTIQATTGITAGNEVAEPENGAMFGVVYDQNNTAAPVLFVPSGTTGGTAVNLGGCTMGGTVLPAGGSLPVGIMNPYLVVNAMIALEGIFPSRN